MGVPASGFLQDPGQGKQMDPAPRLSGSPAGIDPKEAQNGFRGPLGGLVPESVEHPASGSLACAGSPDPPLHGRQTDRADRAVSSERGEGRRPSSLAPFDLRDMAETARELLMALRKILLEMLALLLIFGGLEGA